MPTLKMPTLKPKRLIFALPLLGAVYFAAFSGLESPLLKQELILLPVQVGVLVYLLWWQREKP
ncbi:MAG: hypothetical protein KME15_15690 [Drouetiella hepatica Uher 2000/2452]|jgi:hypothetical protein|uniref:Uncharacterized protein n=1 Tax=Drouetiella hepatica Uher 2000/2452 TaxID=904376 RepID=A0A951QBA5_9CYAN|nr:hypothetical protein [Drouetiella hepatica Uher 2000/2452]